MRFLADESCDFAVVLALRAASHDVVAIAESRPGITDRDVMDLAETEHRIVITEDKDFGQLAFSGSQVIGCVLLRYPASARLSMGLDVVRLVELLGDRISRCFVTAEPGRTRLTRLPASTE